MNVIAQHQQTPEQRIAQKTLAKEFITDLHWQAEYEKVQKIIDVLFWDTDKLAIISNMSEDEKSALARETWSVKLQWDEVRLLDLIVESGLASSNWETKKLIQSGSIYFNEEKVEDIQKVVKSDDLVNWVGLLRKWKKSYKLILG
jgi:tyrosyl-tRNA synthetase